MDIQLSYYELSAKLEHIMLNNGFDESGATQCAAIFTDNTFAGVASHGVNRFAHFINMVRIGIADPQAKPELVNSFGAIEQWNGNYGVGLLNALFCTDRAIEIAKQNGIWCVALRNTNHWMRAGWYGWRAAEKGYILIAWTNTIPNLPPWGSSEARTGNNPVVIAFPRANGHVVLDISMSLFSYGKLHTYKLEGKQLPFEGGYDSNGELTKDAAAIYKTMRALPIGLWKGTGLSLVFDLIAAVLSGGNATREIAIEDFDRGVSQIYIAMKPDVFGSRDEIDRRADEIIEYFKSAKPIHEGDTIFYPGERAGANMRGKESAIPVNSAVWDKILNL